MMVWADGVMCVMTFWFYDIPLTHMTLGIIVGLAWNFSLSSIRV